MEKIIMISASEDVKSAFPVTIEEQTLDKITNKIKKAIEIILFTESLKRIARDRTKEEHFIEVVVSYGNFDTLHTYRIEVNDMQSLKKEISGIVNGGLSQRIQTDILQMLLSEIKDK